MRLTGLTAIGLFLMLLFSQSAVSLTDNVVDQNSGDSSYSLLEEQDGGDSNVEKEKYDDIDHFIKKVKPVAVFDYSPVNPTAGDSVHFNGEKSYDVDGKIVSYSWSFVADEVSHFPVTMGSGKRITYSWDEPGDYLVTLKVVDDDGLMGVSQKKVHVERPLTPPSADFIFSPSTPKMKEKVFFDASKSSDDGEIVGYSWSYVSIVSRTPVAMGTGRTIEYSWSEPGDYIVTLEVVDDDGLTGSMQRTVHVEKVSSPPTADFVFSPSNPRVGETVTFDASRSVDDGGIVAYEWDFGNGETAFGEKVEHSFVSTGVYTVKLTVTDDEGLKDTCSKTVAVNESDVDNDTDGDGIPDSVDEDDDNDGWSDEEEVEYGTDPKDASDYPIDSDGDGFPDSVDEDDDNDGVDDSDDAFPSDPKEWADTDNDGLGDNADSDDDNDGWSDAEEVEKGTDPKDPEDHPEESNDDGGSGDESKNSNTHHSTRSYSHHTVVETESIQSNGTETVVSNEEQANESAASYHVPQRNDDEGNAGLSNDETRNPAADGFSSEEKDYTLFYYVIGVFVVLVLTLMFLPKKKEERKEVAEQNRFSFTVKEDSKEEIVYISKRNRVVSEVFSP
ncbi:MAG: PKD domain-containing protein [Thermoplasmata archaeon]|nr:PKD domain-containing protein [Thermoplasmata archaeon]